jgi:replication initiation and membrane attachment protein DnaB
MDHHDNDRWDRDMRDIYDIQDTESKNEERNRTYDQTQKTRDEHPEWFREPGNEEKISGQIFEELKSQYQDAQESQIEEIPTDDEW